MRNNMFNQKVTLWMNISQVFCEQLYLFMMPQNFKRKVVPALKATQLSPCVIDTKIKKGKYNKVHQANFLRIPPLL